MIKYSIIIPTLNEEKLIQQLLEVLSLDALKKKYNFEIIISDGGSTDATIDIAKKYADLVLMHDPKTPQNIALGRNLGAHSAKGDILFFYNGDILPENMDLVFETVESKFENSDYLAMTCNVKVFPNQQKIIDVIFLTFYNYYFHLLIYWFGYGKG